MRIPYQKGACRVSSPYGPRVLNGVSGIHTGIDLVGLDGDRVLVAPCDGVIKTSTIIPQSSGNVTWEWGNYVRIDSNDGYTVYMCHMAERRVKAGQAVLAGDVVGIQGNTGYSFGEHCHFEVRRNNTPINPAPLLGIQNAVGVYANPSPSPAPSEIAVGSGVWFVGTRQYASSSSEKPVDAQPCRAQVSTIYPKGRHPYHIVGDGVHGWVDKSDIATDKPRVVRVTAYLLNVRSGPGTNYYRINQTAAGDVHVIVDTAGGWGKLKSGGWISLAYTEEIKMD